MMVGSSADTSMLFDLALLPYNRTLPLLTTMWRSPHRSFLKLLLLLQMTQSNRNGLPLLHLDVQPVSELNLITTGITTRKVFSPNGEEM